MASQTRTVLKTYFETGDTPSQSEFSDLIDSFYSLASDFKVLFGYLSQSGTNAPVLTTIFSSLTAVPTFGYGSVGSYSMTSVGNLDVAKTFILIGVNGSGDFGIETYSLVSPDSFEIDTFSSGIVAANGILSTTPIIIVTIP